MTTSSSQQQSGQIILGNYRVGASIGQGTFGKVKLGTHILTQQKVAIKTLQKQKIVQQSDIQRVTREICILKILRHPNIIQLYQIIETKTDIHLIMQYAQGGQLFDYIVKRKRLDEPQAIKFMQQIIAGVQYIHKNGIVHRDLKPQNLLLDHNKNIKIVDFGLSNQYKPGQKLKTACGSPCYAAPQMIAGKRYECLSADIWSCGIILYAMLCGYLPFEDPNTNKLYKKIIAGDFEMPKILSPDAKEILRAILNVNPQTRYKIQQIRDSRWFNLTSMKYQSKGIIVGKDQIQPVQQLVKNMQSLYNVDPVQARTYIINNRHNHTTALYYLLEIKLSREGKLIVGAKGKSVMEDNFLGKDAVMKSPTKRDEVKERDAVKEKQREKQRQREKQKERQRESLKQKEKQKQKQKKRQSSPLIYRPQQKPQHYIPYNTKKPASKQHSTKNDSMNVSNIISSLVQANKNKLINKPQPLTTTNAKRDQVMFNKEDFKLFPNKKNSSIYEPSSASKVSTSRSKYDDRSFQFGEKMKSGTGGSSQNVAVRRIGGGNLVGSQQAVMFGSGQKEQQARGSVSSMTHQSGKDSARGNGEQFTSNKKRQQLSDQLKQISLKIDQQIMQLRKQNSNGGSVQQSQQQQSPPLSGSYNLNNVGNLNSSREMHNSSQQMYITQSGQRKKSQGGQYPSTTLPVSKDPTSRESLPLSNSIDLSHRQSFQSQHSHHLSSRQQQEIKVHSGPFNTQCIFMENARSLMMKISSYLSRNSIRFSQSEPFNLLMGDGEKISVEALQGIAGVHLVKFSSNNVAFNQAVIQVLSK